MQYFFYFITIITLLFLNNCGGSLTNTSKNNSNNKFTIDINKVPNYSPASPIRDQYLAVINYLRSQTIQCNDPQGFSGPSAPLTLNASLESSAKEHSTDMKISGKFSHAGSGRASDITGQIVGHPSLFNERILYNGYNGTRVLSENIAMATSKPNPLPQNYWITIMEGWINSTSGHCSNIMNPQTKDFGMNESSAIVNGSGQYTTYWTQNFGAP
jgi:uncharacterized protein YkwD